MTAEKLRIRALELALSAGNGPDKMIVERAALFRDFLTGQWDQQDERERWFKSMTRARGFTSRDEASAASGQASPPQTPEQLVERDGRDR